MINPGASAMPNARTANLPTSSGVMGGPSGVLSTEIFRVNGWGLTIGLLIMAVAAFLIFNMFFTRRRR